jgi:hypothetical protein
LLRRQFDAHPLRERPGVIRTERTVPGGSEQRQAAPQTYCGAVT